MVNVNEPSPIEHKIRVLEMLASPKQRKCQRIHGKYDHKQADFVICKHSAADDHSSAGYFKPDILVSLSRIVH